MGKTYFIWMMIWIVISFFTFIFSSGVIGFLASLSTLSISYLWFLQAKHDYKYK